MSHKHRVHSCCSPSTLSHLLLTGWTTPLLLTAPFLRLQLVLLCVLLNFISSKLWSNSSMCWRPVRSAPLMKIMTFSSMYLWLLYKNSGVQKYMYLCINLQLVPLINISIFMLISYFLLLESVVQIEIRAGDTFSSSFMFRIVLVILGFYFLIWNRGLSARRWWHTPLVPVLGRQRQKDLCEFETSLVYKS